MSTRHPLRFFECVGKRGHAFVEDVCERCGAQRGGPTLLDLVKEMGESDGTYGILKKGQRVSWLEGDTTRWGIVFRDSELNGMVIVEVVDEDSTVTLRVSQIISAEVGPFYF